MGGAGLPISIEGIGKRFGRHAALQDVSLEIGAGEFLTLLGPSGSGKTTLLNVIAGFLRPNHGELRFGTEPVLHVPPHRRNLGMVFQNHALFPHMTVAANIAYPLGIRGIHGTDAAARVTRVLDLVRLTGFGERRVTELSGGQSQRVALARAIVFEPHILLMDEPLSALDKNLREQMQIELRLLHETLGMTTIYVTHDQREALTLADRVAVMNAGRIEQVGSPREVYDRPATTFVAGFVGDSTFLKIERQGGQAILQGRPLKTEGALPPDGPLLLALRPEKLELLAGTVAADGLNYLEGSVSRVIYQGESLLVSMRLTDGTELTVRQLTGRGASRSEPVPGQQVNLAFHPADTLIIAAGSA